MNKGNSYIIRITGMASGIISYLLGDFDVLLKGITCMVALDYITGIMKAIYLKKLSSSVGVRGIIKKLAIFIAIAVANIIQIILQDKIPLRETIIMFYIINEAISILENLSQFISIPQKMSDVLLKMKDDEEGKKE